ncbi:UDP-glycosyltransferase 89C1-like [Gossypium australe]|uniref:UDP-glycosyltransferase 89C1-like n=1 Tax=Gossypium australe TaxID=47621 RepID=A0A5B6WT72_9ROSI|nr:UDP-glycosyltransferase 89C1-like [Gossypium australe]
MRYFHVRATGRANKNIIDRLTDDNGRWVIDIHDISNVAGDYFSKLFKSNEPSNVDTYINDIHTKVTPEMNANLAKHFTDEEIMVAFNQMDLHKAPGINGLSGIFFKENWEVVRKDGQSKCIYTRPYDT